MWNPFKRKEKSIYGKAAEIDLVFKSTDAAFEYASKYMTEPGLHPGGTGSGKVIKVYEGNPPMFDVRLSSSEDIVLKRGPEVFTAKGLRDGITVTPIKLNDFVSVEINSYTPERAVWGIMSRLTETWLAKYQCFKPDVPDHIWKKYEDRNG
jgi:hypothetical protein